MKGKFKYKSKTIRYKLKMKNYCNLKIIAVVRIGRSIFTEKIDVLEFNIALAPYKNYRKEEEFLNYIDSLTDEELRQKAEKRIKWKIDFEEERNEIENKKIKLSKRISKRIEG